MEASEVLDIVREFKPGYRVYEPDLDELKGRNDKLMVLIESPSGYQQVVVISKSKRRLVGVD